MALWRLSLGVALALSTAHATIQRDPWTLHDPDFPVRVAVAPFGDDQWNSTQAELSSQEALLIPSSVLNLSVVLPTIANVTSTEVSVTLFRKKKLKSGTTSRDVETDDDLEDDRSAFVVLADTQVQYAKSYRLDVGTQAQAMIMRVYVESQLSSGRVMRALFVRPLSLTPSEPFHIECDSNAEVALRITSYPPTNVPKDLCSEYTMGGRVPVRKWYFDDQSDVERTYEARSFEFIEDLVQKAKERKRYYYGATDDYLYAALEKYPIRDKHVLIVGSTIPWYEAICIAMEAASCTTIDYNKLQYNHPKIKTFTVGEFESSSERKEFDAILSISSFEHDGLGRYGDVLDPNADLKAMKGLAQYTTRNTESASPTKVFLAVPVGADCLVWNAQRVYGPLRLPLLMTGWSLVESFGFAQSDFTAPFTVTHQPLFVLKQEPEAKSPEHSEL